MITGNEKTFLAFSIAAILSGCGGGVDGYVAGARVFLDLNGNGVADGGEPSTTTDGQGKYTLTGISLLPGQTLASSQLVLTASNN